MKGFILPLLFIIPLSPTQAAPKGAPECFIQVDSRFEKEDENYRNLEANIPVKSLEECVKAAQRAAELKFSLDEAGSPRLGDLKNSYSKFIFRSGNIVFKGKYRLDQTAPP
jgi:hypothetical protein